MLSVSEYIDHGFSRPYHVDKEQKQAIGTIKHLNGNTFVYGKAAGTLTPNMGAKIKNPQDVSQEIIGAAAVSGATKITVTLDSTDGPTYNRKMPENYLANGVIVIFPAAKSCMVRTIISNTAQTATNSSTKTFDVELDAPIVCDLTTSDVAEMTASPWAAVVPNTATKLTDNLCSVCGIPTCDAVDGDFLWFQIGGMTWTSPDAALGAGASNRDARYNGDGSVSDGDDTNTADIEQRAGFVVANDKGGGQGAPFIMLDPMV
jgi:hypothetical protein